MTESDDRRWVTREPAIVYFHKKFWFNIIAMIREEGVSYYCNLASQMCIRDSFMAYNDNYKHCLGIIGTGNRNFAGIYIFTAKELSAKYQIPLLYDFEFNGTPADVAEMCIRDRQYPLPQSIRSLQFQ